ncbi:MAG: hypothetical protein KDA41_14425, partial [Planctomycetales bacterium]|nr:hypothetical protein [Planctomycetales bacterium]
DDIRRWYRESDRPQPRWVPVAPLGLLRRLSQQLDAQIRFYADGGFNIDVDAARRRYPWLKTFREWVVSDAWVAATGVPKRLTLRQLLQRGARLGL